MLGITRSLSQFASVVIRSGRRARTGRQLGIRGLGLGRTVLAAEFAIRYSVHISRLPAFPL